ncbi:MAG: signal peptidase II [Pseudanabaenaceae cyanobacterium]
MHNFAYWLTAIATLLLDQGTKQLAIWFLRDQPSVLFWQGVLHFSYATNDGAAFSFFAGQVDWLKWVSLVVSLGLILWGWFAKWVRLEQIGYGLILGGALGNGIDRFVYGYVVDFLEIRLFRFPIFNLADVAINLGLVCLVWAVWREGQTRK